MMFFLLFHRLLAITLMFSLHSVRVHYDVQKAMCLRMDGQVRVAKLFNLHTLLASILEVCTHHTYGQIHKTCLKWPLKKKTKNDFQDQLSLKAGQKYCRMLRETCYSTNRKSLD